MDGVLELLVGVDGDGGLSTLQLVEAANTISQATINNDFPVLVGNESVL